MNYDVLLMPSGICLLCRNHAELQLSHVVPAFIFRWLRDSSGNSHMRSTVMPNRRIQDGVKEHWLCASCEGRFNRVETCFANELFYPYLAESGREFRYGEWLLEFCTSVSWRVLQYHLHNTNGDDKDHTTVARIERAEETWRAFLLDEIPHPGAFRQHLIPLDRIESATGQLPPNINRYLMRMIQIDLCHGGETLFTFAKLGRFIILGFINEPNPGHWIGSRINANHGCVKPRTYIYPIQFRDYLFNKADSVAESLASISDRQQEKIDESFRTNIDKFRDSDFFQAMDADVQMFGSSAFVERKRKDDSER